MVKDNWLTETATFWKHAPEVKSGEVKPQDIKTEVFFFPSAQIAEIDGTFTNTQRLLQWHDKAADPPGDCRSDLWFTHQLAKRLKKLYAESTLPRDQGFKNLTWDFDPDRARTPRRHGGRAVDALKILKEINGYQTADPGRHLAGFGELKDDGSTTCAAWIYCGVFPAPDKNLRRQPRSRSRRARLGAQLGWGFAWPANRRIMYNRASADPKGQPWSERKRWVWWDGAEVDRLRRAPTSRRPRPRTPRPSPTASASTALSGTDPFIMKADGKGWLFVPTGLRRRAAAHALRAGRVAGEEPALQAAGEPRLQVLEARRQPAGRRSATRSFPT